jgi:hypothetical protein
MLDGFARHSLTPLSGTPAETTSSPRRPKPIPVSAATERLPQRCRSAPRLLLYQREAELMAAYSDGDQTPNA